MTDTKQLIEYALHPELALQNLSDLMVQLESPDETAQNYSCEALENCGTPRLEDVPFLLEQLNSQRSTRVYWASTLLGRFGLPAKGFENRLAIQDALASVIADESLELSAREKAAWAIGELGMAESSNRERLQKIADKASPRLKRLLEAALSQE
jgi:hypothetical protein